VRPRLRYLLDTNMLSDLVKNPGGKVAARIARVGEDSICTSLIAAAELRYAAAKSGSRKIADRVELVLSAIEGLPLEAPADQHYAEIRDHLTRHDTPIGPNDLLIAAHALAENLVVVTANSSEFGRVPGLAVENWLTNKSK
jgi:tRNA(fMet)-specific endonuclease VapC